MCAAAGGVAEGGGASGRIHDKDTEEFSETELMEHKESFHILINTNSFVSLLWKTQQEVAQRVKYKAPFVSKIFFFFFN